MILKTHMDNIEQLLSKQFTLSAALGHDTNVGTAREAFIHNFLGESLGTAVGIGQGEIIDSTSTDVQSRNQIDVVIFDTLFPKLHFGGGINAYLTESVYATVEVKSCLTEAELRKATRAAIRLKSMRTSSRRDEYDNPVVNRVWPTKMLNFVVAYDCRQSMATVAKWLIRAHDLNNSPLPTSRSLDGTNRIPSSGLDGAFILGKGFVLHLGIPFIVDPAMHRAHPQMRVTLASQNSGNLLLLFLILNEAISSLTEKRFDLSGYVQGLTIADVRSA